MVANFFNEFKNNFSFFKTKLVFIVKGLNYLIVFDLLCVLFIVDILFNLNLLTFILNFFFLLTNYLLTLNFLVIVILFFIISTRNLILNKLSGKSNFIQKSENSNQLYLGLLFIIYSRLNIKSNLIFFLNYLNLLFFKSNFILNFFNILLIENFKNLYWYPIFKRHSIFGYYRIARQNWVELKSEEVNYIKY